MGVYIELYKYDYDKLVNKIIEVGGIEDTFKNRKKLDLTLSKCGEKIGDKYILLNNELYEGYNPYYNVSEVIENVFGLDEDIDIFDVFCSYYNYDVGKERLISSFDTNEVLEDIKIELSEIDEVEE